VNERVKARLWDLVCWARFALERANGYQLVPGVPPSPLYRLRVSPEDWDAAFVRELGD
jgi:hypothetical protein